MATVMLPTRPAMRTTRARSRRREVARTTRSRAGFESLCAQKPFSRRLGSAWRHRIHGTTGNKSARSSTPWTPKTVAAPPSLFPAFEEAPRRGHRDGYIELQRRILHGPPRVCRSPGLGAVGVPAGAHLQSTAGSHRRSCAGRTGKVRHRSNHLHSRSATSSTQSGLSAGSRPADRSAHRSWAEAMVQQRAPSHTVCTACWRWPKTSGQGAEGAAQKPASWRVRLP